MKNNKIICLGGFGEINFGKQYREGNRVYDSRYLAVAIKASPCGNMGGQTNLYLVIEYNKDYKVLKIGDDNVNG